TKLQVDMRHLNIPKTILIDSILPVLFSKSFLNHQENIDTFRQLTLMNPLPQSDKGYIAQVEALREHHTTHLLTKITCPTLIIGCEEDVLTPYEGSIVVRNFNRYLFYYKALLIFRVMAKYSLEI
ncbi:MAG: alpha/beta hydrolase, partial [Gammaproteobacteria bacterium]|nr:alpha/beta hydrolase [Gammaproteobacteria bacterium]